MKNQILTRKICIVFYLAFSLCLNITAQDWETILTPVTTNLILYDISFPSGQSDIGFTGGSSVTFNGKGKILKTTNQGANWEVVYESDDNGTGVSAITFFDPSNGFAGTQGGNIMKTIDGGNTWTSTDFDPNTDQGEIRDIEFFDANNGVILSGWGGIYITSDGGDNWTAATTNIIGAQELDYADALTLFAVGNQQVIYKSIDGGHNWSTNFTGSVPFAINLGVDFADATHGLVSSQEGNVFVTSDGGNSWTTYTIPNQGGIRGALAVDENNMYTAGAPGSVYKTIDGGVAWTLDSPVDPQPTYYKIIMTDNGNLFVTGSGGMGGTILRKATIVPVTASTTTIDLACNSDNSGSILLEVEGGSAPYTFEWSTGETTQNIENLSAGTYSCTITDNTGEELVVDNLLVSEPQSISVSLAVTDETLEGANDGSISIDTLTGGIPPYIFLWDNGAMIGFLENLPPGDYCFTVTDANGCELIDCATVSVGLSPAINIPTLTSFELSPNPILTGENILLELSFDIPTNIQVSVLNANGREIFFYKSMNATAIQKEVNMSAYPAGIYMVNVSVFESGATASKKLLKLE